MITRRHALSFTARAFRNVPCRTFSQSRIALLPRGNTKPAAAKAVQRNASIRDEEPHGVKRNVKIPSETVEKTAAKLNLQTTTAAAPVPNAKQKFAYPESLLIWNAGIFKNALIGLIKTVPLVYMGYGWTYWAPWYYYSANTPSWWAIPAVVFVTIPFILTRKATAPYVATVHILLPASARVSKEALGRFSANMPRHTTVEFTTVGLLGLQKRVVTTLDKLSPHDSYWGIGNIERVVEKTEKGASLWDRYRTWVLGKNDKLYVGGQEGQKRSNAPGMWDAVQQHIESHVSQYPQKSKN